MHRLLPAGLALATTLLCAACATSVPTASPRYAIDIPTIDHPSGETTAWWFRNGASQAAARGAMGGHAKNVIVFLGDGMSLTTVAAARILEGQRNGHPGEENRLSWEDFPYTALSKTYNTDSQTPDSAGTMSAIATGVKTRIGVISVGPEVPRGNCEQAKLHPTTTLWELAASQGMDVGIVTSTRVTHATPAATFTHVPDRNWEVDEEMPEEARAAGCIDIARQLVESPLADRVKVLMGGGRSNFMPAADEDPEYGDKHGLRLDGRDLIGEWRAKHPGGAYVWNAKQLADAPAAAPLLGLFDPSHMHYVADRDTDKGGEPDLATMTRAAISRLSRSGTGYVLLVEGGRIDHANHEGNAYRALTETVAFSDAVRAAMQATSADDTLILVTADHSHTLSFVGYPQRGNPILGKVKGSSGEGDGKTEYALDATGRPYTTLNYSNGPGYTGATDQQPEGTKHYPHLVSGAREAGKGRPDLTRVDTTDKDYMQEALVPMASETHGGDDVGIWARGPGSEAVRGSLEENSIFHVLLQATPRLRNAVCKAGGCDTHGVPVTMPATIVPRL
ncbi:alkaline phosphatase [Lysobacter sp. TY2-98]|uniref:alkaline phosphatase n=1 Tax=Lysobacter sp. TY2-98 TaxID=2290922 RepID=UPI000E208813|nr:alkaline phosphatase [Lysobacter sp. TY2-98]AXK72441.1 alkaline phosphatase [Lysobacter sp. TY2-98]